MRTARTHTNGDFLTRTDPLASVNLKINPEKRRLADLKNINLSELLRTSLDIRLGFSGVTGEGEQMLTEQLAEIEKQMEILQLEKKIVLDQLSALRSKETVALDREMIYQKWKKSLAFQVERNTIDWTHQKQLFKFKRISDCKKWILSKLEADNLI